MSSDEGLIDYHHTTKSHYHQQLSPKKLHNQTLSIHNGNVNINDLHATNNGHHLNGIVATSPTQPISCCDINNAYSGGTIKRRKSLTNGSVTGPVNVSRPNPITNPCNGWIKSMNGLWLFFSFHFWTQLLQISGNSIHSIDGNFAEPQSMYVEIRIIQFWSSVWALYSKQVIRESKAEKFNWAFRNKFRDFDRIQSLWHSWSNHLFSHSPPNFIMI